MIPEDPKKLIEQLKNARHSKHDYVDSRALKRIARAILKGLEHYLDTTPYGAAKKTQLGNERRKRLLEYMLREPDQAGLLEIPSGGARQLAPILECAPTKVTKYLQQWEKEDPKLITCLYAERKRNPKLIAVYSPLIGEMILQGVRIYAPASSGTPGAPQMWKVEELVEASARIGSVAPTVTDFRQLEKALSSLLA